MAQVVKRDGTKEPYDLEKVRLAVAFSAKDAGFPHYRIRDIVNQVLAVVDDFVGRKEEVTAVELAEKIYNELEKIEPEVASAYRKYEEERRSK